MSMVCSRDQDPSKHPLAICAPPSSTGRDLRTRRAADQTTKGGPIQLGRGSGQNRCFLRPGRDPSPYSLRVAQTMRWPISTQGAL